MKGILLVAAEEGGEGGTAAAPQDFDGGARAEAGAGRMDGEE